MTEDELIQRIKALTRFILERNKQNVRHNKKPIDPGEPSEAVRSTNANGSCVAGAISAAVALGVKRAVAERWARLAPDKSDSGRIVAFILRSLP